MNQIFCVILEAMRCSQYPIMLNYCSSAIDWFHKITDIEYSNSIRVLFDVRFLWFKHRSFSWKFIQVGIKNWDTKNTLWNITRMCHMEKNTKNDIRNEIHFNICSNHLLVRNQNFNWLHLNKTLFYFIYFSLHCISKFRNSNGSIKLAYQHAKFVTECFGPICRFKCVQHDQID